ncbi:MAG: AAA family ATPase [Candidatus Hydrogenedentes bacterium]|nr:AAA family ATPase [Candidatus Hydrogenedentota bacterium]
MSGHTIEGRPLKLAQYLREFVGLRTTTVRDVQQYESVLWFSEMPHDRDCRSGVWEDGRDSSDPWLEVKKQSFEKTPVPPEHLLAWLDQAELRTATVAPPTLRASALLVDENAEHGDGEPAPLTVHNLEDHPEVVEAYERYRPKWEAWSEQQRRRESIQRVYAELFRLHTQLRKQSEIVEVVLGLGLLNWRVKLKASEISVRRHVVVANVEIEFEPAEGVIRLLPPGDGAKLRIEDDMLEAELRPERSHYDVVLTQLEEIGDDIWDRSRIDTALRVWSGALSADSQYFADTKEHASTGNSPCMTFAPALILRKRTQSGMVKVYDALISQLTDDSLEIPKAWLSLTDDIPDESDSKASAQPDSGGGLQSPHVVYFPLAANREQRRIVEAIDRRRGVLVQGPPGTGKSHTIANLISHLLATGKRVLVTAETGRALGVLKGMLPPEIQSLCVSLLGQGGDSFAELNLAIQGITTRQASYNPSEYKDKIADIESDLDEARRRQAKTLDEIRSLRADETVTHSVAGGEYRGSASAIAHRVALESSELGWLQPPEDSDDDPPLSSELLKAWLQFRRRYSDEDARDAQLTIPQTSELPDPQGFARAVADACDAAVAYEQGAVCRSHPAYGPISAVSESGRKQLEDAIRILEKRRVTFEQDEGNWASSALTDLLSGRRAKWTTLLHLSQEKLPTVQLLLDKVGTRFVKLSDGFEPRKVRSDAGAALAYLRSGGAWKQLLVLTPGELKGRLYLKDSVLVDGIGASDVEKLQTVCDHLDLEFALEELLGAWAEVESSPPTSIRKGLVAALKEREDRLAQCFKYADECGRVSQAMRGANPPIPIPNWLNGQAKEWLELISATSLEVRLKHANEIANFAAQSLIAYRHLHNVHPVVKTLAQAVEKRDTHAYSESYANLQALETTRADLQKRNEIESDLNRFAPRLTKTVSESVSDSIWDVRFEKWEQAWRWARANAWLEHRSNFEYQRKLWKRCHEIEREIGQLVAEIAALRAWMHFFDRLTQREAAALRSWREAVKAMGKGTGKSARMARLRREARQYMDACRDAIPVWIMPRYLVAEMVNPTPERYDVLIVDEASQLGIESLFLFYLAKKIVVVGDDQQISPYGVGIADDAVDGLQRHFLDGMPHRHALSPQSSLYGNAKIRFSHNIVLREHFRCMPEIIQFSNDLCYASNGTPLDPLRAYPANRLQPLVLRHVADGYREGSTQYAQNPPEADAIISQIVACLDDPRYAGRTMGVISLQGDAQARLIERKMLQILDPEIIEERRLICGDAYAFQGDERDVIFLSMVAAPGDTRIGALTDDSARQRFNVAVSRARDQLWLFHTATLDVLSNRCMRYRLLGYMENPSRVVLGDDGQKFDSQFERDVFEHIIHQGFHVRTQVGVGDTTNHRYRIDLVVEGMQGRLAVECDGDQWHGLERYEQDMARQRDLERAGWHFARIRGGDFYRDQERAMSQVWTELDRLGIKPGGIDETLAAPPHPKNTEELEIELSDPADVDADQDIPEPDNLESTQQSEIPGLNDEVSMQEQPERQQAETEPMPQAPAGDVSEDQPSLFSAQACAAVCPTDQAPYVNFNGEVGPDPRDASPARVADGLCRIVSIEGPMLAKRAYDIYLRGTGIKRMGGELKRTMNRALQLAIRSGRIVKEDEYEKGGLVYSIIRPAGTPQIRLRTRGPRDFEEIPPSEVQLVARMLAKSEGLEPKSDAHLRAVLDHFDLKRLTVQVGTALLDILGRQYAYVDDIIGEELE